MRVFVVAGADYSTCAPDSWGARLIDATEHGSLPIQREQGSTGFFLYIFYGPQKLADNAKNVDVIITLKKHWEGSSPVSRESIVNDSMFKNTPAVKNGRVWGDGRTRPDAAFACKARFFFSNAGS